MDRNIYTATGVTALTDMSFTLNHQVWESDYSTWTCTPQSGDDYVHAMNYSVNFKKMVKLIMLIFRQIHFRIITEAILLKMDGLMVLGLLPQAQELLDVCIKTIWRYTNGYDCNHPLDFEL